jgi:hypothetical protein
MTQVRPFDAHEACLNQEDRLLTGALYQDDIAPCETL